MIEQQMYGFQKDDYRMKRIHSDFNDDVKKNIFPPGMTLMSVRFSLFLVGLFAGVSADWIQHVTIPSNPNGSVKSKSLMRS